MEKGTVLLSHLHALWPALAVEPQEEVGRRRRRGRRRRGHVGLVELYVVEVEDRDAAAD